MLPEDETRELSKVPSSCAYMMETCTWEGLPSDQASHRAYSQSAADEKHRSAQSAVQTTYRSCKLFCRVLPRVGICYSLQ